MARVATLNSFWFGFDPSREPPGSSLNVRFVRDGEDRDRFRDLVRRLDVDLLALQEVVDMEAMEATLAPLGRGWRMRDGASALVASPRVPQVLTRNPLHVAWAWNSERVELLRWMPIEPVPGSGHAGAARPPIAARWRFRGSGYEITAVAVHTKSGNPRWRDVPGDVEGKRSAEKRHEELAMVAAWLLAPPEGFATKCQFVIGDFNSLAGGFELEPLVSGALGSWRVLSPDFRPPTQNRASTRTDANCVIDHVVASPKAVECVAKGPEIYTFDEDPTFHPDVDRPDVWRGTTDHRPVSVELVPRLPAQLERLSSEPLPLSKDVSGVVGLGDEEYLLAHDEHGIFFWRRGSAAIKLRGPQDHRALGDIESVCVDEAGTTVYTISESTGIVLALDVSRVDGVISLSPPRALGTLPRPGNEANKGWEGMAVIPGRWSPSGEARLIAAHEGAPRALAIYGLSDLVRRAVIPIGDELGLRDLSDVTVCPWSGHLFLLSDASELLVELALVDESGVTLLGRHALPVDGGSKPEGVALTPSGELLVVTDKSAELLRFRVTRA